MFRKLFFFLLFPSSMFLLVASFVLQYYGVGRYEANPLMNTQWHSKYYDIDLSNEISVKVRFTEDSLYVCRKIFRKPGYEYESFRYRAKDSYLCYWNDKDSMWQTIQSFSVQEDRLCFFRNKKNRDMIVFTKTDFHPERCRLYQRSGKAGLRFER